MNFHKVAKISAFFIASIGTAQVPASFANTIISDGLSHDLTTSLSGQVDISRYSTVNILPGGSLNGGAFVTGATLDFGTVNLNGGSINAGSVIHALGTGSGGADGLDIQSGSVTISSGSVLGGTATNFGRAAGIDIMGGNVNITGGNITGGSVTHGSGAQGIFLFIGGLNISGGTFTGGVANNGGIASAINNLGGNINITGGVFAGGNGASGSWAEAITNEGGTTNIYAGKFQTANSSPRGSGVCVLRGNVNVYGGNFLDAPAFEVFGLGSNYQNTPYSGNLDLYGGVLSSGAILNLIGGTINLHGTDFNYAYGQLYAQPSFGNSTPYSYHLTGILSDGNPLNITINTNSSGGAINLLPVPEPASLALLTLSVPLLLRRRK